jgi:hypothetical protein
MDFKNNYYILFLEIFSFIELLNKQLKEKSMSKIIEFPSLDIRNNTEIEQALRYLLTNNGFSKEIIEQTTDAIMPLIKESKAVIAQGLNVPLPSGISANESSVLEESLSNALQAYQRQVGDFTLKVILLFAFECAKKADTSSRI